MSGHADTIREGLDFYARNPQPTPRTVAGPPCGLRYDRALAALDALVAEIQQQAQTIKELAYELAGWQLRYGDPPPDGVEPLPVPREFLVAENQQLRDALALADETIRGLADQQAMPDDFYQATLTRISVALDGTPSEDTE